MPLPRRYRAPRGEGEILADPSLAEAGALIARNAAAFAASGAELAGQSLGESVQAARRELLDKAFRYTSAYRNAPPLPANPRVVMAGHQPVLFHPGVWLKHFALSGLAARHAAVAVNLLADNDTIRGVAVRVPTGSPADPRIEHISYDAAGPEVAHEERAILDPGLLRSFAKRTEQALAGLVEHPLVTDYWPRVLEAAACTGRLGLSLAQARHQLEGDWGATTLELPLSELCRGPAFARFAAVLLADAGRFGECYNAAVTDYRNLYKIRSRSHPVPLLEADEAWRETPLWLWTADNPRRRRAFVREHAGDIELTDRDQLRLPLGRAGNAERLAAALGELPATVRLRPRALVTTLFARLVLSDLFIHGIGGGMYDQVTDAILRTFFRVEPPEYLVLTGTYRLPIARPSATPDDLLRLDRQLRQLAYDPGRHIDPRDPRAAALAAERAAWVARELPKGERRERHQTVRRLDEALQPFVAERRRELLSQRQQMAEELRRARLLASREFAFCLFPAEIIRKQLLDLLPSER